MAMRVLPAFSASGFSKAGMPLLMASTPVRAVQPEAKARRTRNSVRGWRWPPRQASPASQSREP